MKSFLRAWWIAIGRDYPPFNGRTGRELDELRDAFRAAADAHERERTPEEERAALARLFAEARRLGLIK